MLKIQPTCRYGHGNLEKHLSPIDGVGYLLPGFRFTSTQTNDVALMGKAGFSVMLYECKTCGYIELFDDLYEVDSNG